MKVAGISLFFSFSFLFFFFFFLEQFLFHSVLFYFKDWRGNYLPSIVPGKIPVSLESSRSGRGSGTSITAPCRLLEMKYSYRKDVAPFSLINI